MQFDVVILVDLGSRFNRERSLRSSGLERAAEIKPSEPGVRLAKPFQVEC